MWGREDAPVPVATGSVVAVAPPPRWVSFFLGVRLGVQLEVPTKCQGGM